MLNNLYQLRTLTSSHDFLEENFTRLRKAKRVASGNSLRLKSSRRIISETRRITFHFSNFQNVTKMRRSDKDCQNTVEGLIKR